MSGNNKKFGLGRGLDTLLGGNDEALTWNEPTKTADNKNEKSAPAGKNTLPIDKIVPSTLQPRHEFDAEALQALSDSIRDKGVLQPLLVRPTGEGKYELVAGERRWRAAQMAELKEVPAIIKVLTDREALEIALIENLQRENLSPIEEAEGINRLIEEYEYTQETAGQAIGKSRAYITNVLRLLLLPREVQKALSDEKITVGHARALVGCENAVALAALIIKKGLSVRDAEKLAAAAKNTYGREPAQKRPPLGVDMDLEQIMQDLQQKLQLKVKINTGKMGKGSVTLHYSNPAELSVILDILEKR